MKIKIIIFALSLFGLKNMVFSQMMTRQKMNPTDSLRAEGNILGAIAEHRKMYLKNPKDQRNIYNYACALSIGKQIDSCFKYLNIAVEMDTSTSALTDSDFVTVRKDKRWQEFENKLIAMVNVKFKNPYKDIEYARALWKLRAFDQAYQDELVIAGRKLGLKSSVHEALWSFKFMINEQNQKELVALINKKGWPKANDVGKDGVFTAWLVIQHSNSELQEKYIPDIKKSCEANELPWERYAFVYDRWLFNSNKPQKYGTHTKYNEKTNSEELYPLQDESKVDEWRKELGLQPLSEYLSRFNIN
ncbi:MAG: hypothetical protein EHM93_08840 [Bacteroidales bacterium]|nr:MAG: hypothetical protein EHM93_08840 [Bacteroidales bacterium]